ncbi:MAG: PAS domain S-box protein, partial [Deltaproteobacteria bacterium]
MKADLYRQFFDNLPAYCTVQDRQLKVILANRTFVEDFGEPRKDYCYRLYKRQDKPCESCPVERTFSEGRMQESEERVVCRDGREICVLVQTRPIFDDTGRVEAVLEISTDITAMKKLHDERESERRKYRMLFEQVPCYITIQDRLLNLIDANRRFREDFGDFQGRKCYEAYKHRSEPCLECVVQKAFEDGRVHSTEEVVCSRSGQRNVLVQAAPMVGPSGEIESVIEMSTDITSIRQLQDQLQSIGMMIGSISHTLKGLLTGIEGGRYLVSSGLEKGDASRVERGWSMVERNLERIRFQVFNILYYARERKPQPEEVDLHGFVYEVCEIVSGAASRCGVRFACNVPEENGMIVIDRNAVRTLLINLLENAVDACRVDGAEKEHAVVLDARLTPASVIFTVSDNGIGMDRESREKAFS